MCSPIAASSDILRCYGLDYCELRAPYQPGSALRYLVVRTTGCPNTSARALFRPLLARCFFDVVDRCHRRGLGLGLMQHDGYLRLLSEVLTNHPGQQLKGLAFFDLPASKPIVTPPGPTWVGTAYSNTEPRRMSCLRTSSGPCGRESGRCRASEFVGHGHTVRLRRNRVRRLSRLHYRADWRCSAGSVNVNALPHPGVLVAEILPPCASTTDFEM